MASLLSSMVRANNTDEEKKVEPPVSIPPVATPQAAPVVPQAPQVQPAQPVSIPPVAQQPQARPVQPNPLGAMNIGGLTLNPADAFLKGLLKGPQPVTGLPDIAPRMDTGIANPAAKWNVDSLKQDADDLSTFVGVQNKGRPKYGLEFLDTANEWLKTRPDADKPFEMNDMPIRALVKKATDLRNNPDPAAQIQAKTYADGLLYLTQATLNRDNEKANDAKRYLEQISGYNPEDFKQQSVQRLVAGKTKTINAYAKPTPLASADMAKELDPETIKKRLVGTAIFDYVRDHFSELTQLSQSGGPDAEGATRTLSVFKGAFKDVNAAVTEGSRDARIEAFMGTPQGRALINDAYGQLDGIGFFNQAKAGDLVSRTRKQIQATQRSEKFDGVVTPEEIRDVFGPSRMRRQLRSALNVSGDLSPDTARAFELAPDDENVRKKVYSGLSPKGVGALFGVDDTGQYVGDMDLAQQQDASYYDLSSNVRGGMGAAATTVQGVATGRIQSRAALAGGLAAGMGLSTEQLTQAAQKIYTDPKQIKEFVDAGLSDYSMDSDIVPKIESDLKAVRLQKTGGAKTSGVATNTYNLLTDAFNAITGVIPQEKQGEWNNRRRVVNDIAAQARSLEGSTLESKGSLFAKKSDGTPDYYAPLLPTRDDQVGRIQVLQQILDHAKTDSGYRGELNKLTASALTGRPYTGQINMKPSELKTLVGLYASRLETAATAQRGGMQDQWYTKTFGITPSDLSKTDLKTAILQKMISASPSRLSTFASQLNIDAEGNQKFIPTTDAETVVANASAIPGDTGGKGGKSSRTESAAIKSIDGSLSIMDTAMFAGRKAILKYANDENNEGIGGKSFAIGISNAFKQALTDSLKNVTMTPRDKAKFLNAVTNISDELKESSRLEWTRGTVTDGDVDDLLSKYTDYMRVMSAQKGVPPSKQSEEERMKAIADGETRLIEARKALGETDDQIKATKTKTDQLLAEYRKRNDPYGVFVTSWQTNFMRRAGQADARIKRYEEQIDGLSTRIGDLRKVAATSTGAAKEDAIKAIGLNQQSIVDLNRKIDGQKDNLKQLAQSFSAPPTKEEWTDSQKQELDSDIASDAEREYFKKLNQKLSARGFDSFTPEEKRWYYMANVRRFEAGDRNNIAIGKERRLVFQSFVQSPAGNKYKLDEPVSDAGDLMMPPMNYFIEKKDKGGRVIGVQLNPNMRFTYQWKKNEKTGYVSDVTIIAEDRITEGNNNRVITGKQKIITGVESDLIKSKNDLVDVTKSFASIDTAINKKTPDAKFGAIAEKGRRRQATPMSGVLKDILNLTSQDSLSTANKANLDSLMQTARQNLTGVGDVDKYLEKIIQVNRKAKFADEFAGSLRQKIAERIEAVASNSQGRVFTPKEIQEDLQKYFNLTADELSLREHTQADIELAKKAGVQLREIKDADGKVIRTIPETNIVESILTTVSKDKPPVALTASTNFKDLQLSVVAKLNTYMKKLDDQITYSTDQTVIAKASTTRARLEQVIASVNGAGNKTAINTALNNLTGKEFTDAKNIVTNWNVRKDIDFKQFFTQYKTLQDKVNNGSATETEKKRAELLSSAGNTWFKKNGPSIGANPMSVLYDAAVRREQAEIAQTAIGKKERNAFNVIFGERAMHYVRYDIPTTVNAGNVDEEHYKSWLKKLSKKDQEWLQKEKDFGELLGLDTKNYTFSRGVWADMFSRYDKMSPNQWIEWVYNANIDPAERNRIFANFPAWAGPRNNEAAIAGEVAANRKTLGVTPEGYVVPVTLTAKEAVRLPEWVEKADKPESSDFYKGLFYKIDNKQTAYIDVLRNSTTSRTYTIVDDKGKKNTAAKTVDFLEKDDSGLDKEPKLKAGYKVLGWTEKFTDSNGEMTTRTFEGDHIKHGSIVIEPWNLAKRIGKANVGAKISVDPAKIKKAIEPPFPNYGDKAVADFPLKQGDRLGFRVDGRDFWIGRKDYVDVIDQLRSGKLSTKDVKEITAMLISKVRTDAAKMKEEGLRGHTARPGFATDIKAKVQSGTGSPEGVAIPEDVQDKIIKDAEAVGWSGITKTGAKKGSIAFAMALIALIRDEYLGGKREGREQRGL